ncbi:alpha/beta fold hydrolase [Candidatus Pantoea multigeneris]|uniref:alpha/beta fold hydrolase n=1 Tax=Candidatus Pantoea multigeneris TaxID=2608357 RepID=UPI001F036A8D|nr:alpha/beta hydrolase [Pantoea multigeneris]
MTQELTSVARSAALPVVLIPGFMLDETLWEGFIAAAEGRRRFICASLAEGNSIRQLAEHIVATLPARFVLVGFSLGGYVARAIVEHYPERVAALVLIATSLREDTPEQVQQKQSAAKAMQQGAKFGGLTSSAIARSLHPERAQDRVLINKIKMMGDRLGNAVFLRQSALIRQNISCQPIRCPTLIVAARQDRLRSLAESEELAHFIAGSALHQIDRCGHMVPLEQPEQLAATVLGWLSRLVD